MTKYIRPVSFFTLGLANLVSLILPDRHNWVLMMYNDIFGALFMFFAGVDFCHQYLKGDK